MSSSALQLRRQALQQQCAVQRRALGASLQQVSGQLHTLDRGLGLVRGLRLSPMLLAFGAALALGMGATRVTRTFGSVLQILGLVSRWWRPRGNS